MLIMLALTGCNQDIGIVEDAVCNGRLEAVEDSVDAPFDADEDGFFDASIPGCVETYPPEQLDCDDDDPEVNPDAEEVCDGIDNDCDGTADGSTAVDALPWYQDFDGDGFGNPEISETACEAPSGFIEDDRDCDDEDDTQHPDSEEFCNGKDDNCDGDVDINALDPTHWFADSDGDGYGDADEVLIDCDAPPNTVEDDTDCDDGDKNIHPRANDTYGDGKDSNCDDRDCESGTTGDVHFSVCPDNRTWEQARTECESNGDDLASVQGEEEQAFIEILASAVDAENLWIGFHDQNNEGSFEWTDGSAESYTNWEAGEPNDENGEDCTKLQENISYRWNDAICTYTSTFVCQAR